MVSALFPWGMRTASFEPLGELNAAGKRRDLIVDCVEQPVTVDRRWARAAVVRRFRRACLRSAYRAPWCLGVVGANVDGSRQHIRVLKRLPEAAGLCFNARAPDARDAHDVDTFGEPPRAAAAYAAFCYARTPEVRGQT